MKEETRASLVAFLLCYVTTQVLGLVLDTACSPGPVSGEWLFAGLFFTAPPTIVFAGVMAKITRIMNRRDAVWYLPYLCSAGLALLIFFGVFPFVGTFHPPAFRIPSTEECGLLGEALVAGLMGTYVVRRFWGQRSVSRDGTGC